MARFFTSCISQEHTNVNCYRRFSTFFVRKWRRFSCCYSSYHVIPLCSPGGITIVGVCSGSLIAFAIAMLLLLFDFEEEFPMSLLPAIDLFVVAVVVYI